MKKLLFAAIGLLFSASVSAQDSIIPLEYPTTPAEQYYKYEKNFLECANWFINTPMTQVGTEMPRNMISQFLGTWIEVSPTVFIDLSEDIMCFCNESPELTMAYMIGYTSSLLNLKKDAGTLNTATQVGNKMDEKVAGAVGGILEAAKFYEINKAQLGRNRNLERFIKMNSEGTLTDHVKTLIK